MAQTILFLLLFVSNLFIENYIDANLNYVKFDNNTILKHKIMN